jgi:hypothetical protein
MQRVKKENTEGKSTFLNASCRDRIIKNFALGHNKRDLPVAPIVDKIIKKSFNQFFSVVLSFEDSLGISAMSQALPFPHNCCD